MTLYVVAIVEQITKTTFSFLAARQAQDLVGACIPRKAPVEIAVIACVAHPSHNVSFRLTSHPGLLWV